MVGWVVIVSIKLVVVVILFRRMRRSGRIRRFFSRI